MADDHELAKKCAFDARTLLNDMQGKGHIDELKLLKAMQLSSTQCKPSQRRSSNQICADELSP
jgi:hypothetical protein